MAALRRLAVNYWRPLYVYLRRRGENHEDAADSVQGFFAFVFSSEFFTHVEREGGKFRSYLLRSLERWRSREHRREGALKRGGHIEHVPIDGLEELDQSLATTDVDPERAFDRQWASDMVAQAVELVRLQYEKRGRSDWFAALGPALPGGGGVESYGELAARLDSSEGAVRKAVFDLRKAFAGELRVLIRATVVTAEEAEEELRHLVAVLGDP